MTAGKPFSCLRSSESSVKCDVFLHGLLRQARSKPTRDCSRKMRAKRESAMRECSAVQLLRFMCAETKPLSFFYSVQAVKLRMREFWKIDYFLHALFRQALEPTVQLGNTLLPLYLCREYREAGRLRIVQWHSFLCNCILLTGKIEGNVWVSTPFAGRWDSLSQFNFLDVHGLRVKRITGRQEQHDAQKHRAWKKRCGEFCSMPFCQPDVIWLHHLC